MMRTFSDEKLTEALAALPAAHRAAFAASASERLFPNYEAFVAIEGRGNPTELREGLDAAWSALETGQVDEARLRTLMQHALEIGPNSDDFDGIFTGSAQNATAAVYYTLECCVSGDPERATFVGHDAVESIVDYLLGVAATGASWWGGRFLPDVTAESEYGGRWNRASPLMLAELQAQDEDLAALRAAPTLTPELLREMRARSQKGGIQPFARGLVKREAIPAAPLPIPDPCWCDACDGNDPSCEQCGGSGRVRTRHTAARTAP
jgi:uncharacterized protein YjaG (DUF416 family)